MLRRATAAVADRHLRPAGLSPSAPARMVTAPSPTGASHGQPVRKVPGSPAASCHGGQPLPPPKASPSAGSPTGSAHLQQPARMKPAVSPAASCHGGQRLPPPKASPSADSPPGAAHLQHPAPMKPAVSPAASCHGGQPLPPPKASPSAGSSTGSAHLQQPARMKPSPSPAPGAQHLPPAKPSPLAGSPPGAGHLQQPARMLPSSPATARHLPPAKRVLSVFSPSAGSLRRDRNHLPSSVSLRRLMCTGLPQIPSPPSTLMRPWYDEDEPKPELTSFTINRGVLDPAIKQYEEDYKHLVEEGLDLEEMKKLYYKLVRPVLFASCLILEEPIVSPATKALDQKFKDKFGKPPIYLSALDIMKTLIAMQPSSWSYFMDFMREKHILVTENWGISLGSIECIMHDDSISFMINGRVVYKGQSDGRYKHGDGKADLCTMITGEATKIIDCAIYREVPCKSPTHAELLGMYFLVRRAILLKLLLFDVKTDNSFVSETMRDMFPITSNTTEELCQMLRCMKVYFEHFNCRCEPREKLELVDSLMKMKDHLLTMEVIKEKWAHYLLRLPVFRAHQAAKTIRKNYINKASTVGTVTFHGQYKMVAQGDLAKTEAIVNLVLSLHPAVASVFVEDHILAISVKKEIEKFMKGYLLDIKEAEGLSVVVMKIIKNPAAGGKTLDAGGKTLDILFNAQVGEVYKQTENSVCVKLLDENDTTTPELSPACLLTFG